MSLPSCAAVGLREAWQIGNAIRSHSKRGTLTATDKRGHSFATPGKEGGRNHKHSFPFLHQQGEGGGCTDRDTIAPTVRQWSKCCPHEPQRTDREEFNNLRHTDHVCF